MAKQLPEYHSPLKALGKKVAFYVGLPLAVIAFALFSMSDYEAPEKVRQRRDLQDIGKVIEKNLDKQNAAGREFLKLGAEYKKQHRND